ncbi:MAG: cytochrome c oxidase subunit 3 [Verrucomicrobia bacterium]|nr:cytochrome c oxidase subunit 3 [Verrucomicrobiota bacterium]MDA1004984.1 cytochrome c oxidase subunit 3 [Verrucomicrobiota bacterium]
MEIPYTFTARKDTGLFNSKIGIWLFLASEVMLFGGLFSGYVFLRLYADYPWPERALPVLPGLINTFVLIGSSVTVVFAWASLKMRQWGRFQFFMGITIFCAVIFMVLKGLEYNAKWHHQAVRLDDFTILEGHTHKAELDERGHLHIHHEHGAEPTEEEKKRQFPANVVVVEAEEINFTLVRAHDPYVKDILAKAKERGAVPVLADNAFFYGSPKDLPIDAAERKKLEDQLIKSHASGKEAVRFGDKKDSLYIPKDTQLTVDLLDRAEDVYLEARAINGEVRTKVLRKLWKDAREADKEDLPNFKLAEGIQIDPEEHLTGLVAEAPSALTFTFEKPVALHFKRSLIREGEGSSKLKDDTIIKGAVASSPMGLAVDAVDLRWVAQRAHEQGKDPKTVIEGLWIMENPEFKEIWERHSAQLAILTEELKKDGREPTENDKYRIDWQDLVAFHRAHEKHLEPGSPEVADLRPGMFEGITGPNHKIEENQHAFFSIDIPNEKVGFESLFTPKWNNYYAIYFTLTGLHGLHVVGGALVLAYYMFFSKGLYRRNPEWLANRVEIGGLFWHFVDLVWIFLFPILYLM